MNISDKSAALALRPVSRETEQRFDAYIALLLQWQAKTNLIAPSTISEIWTRHIVDSLQLLDLAPSAKTWVDLGSGGGFPGIVLAAALAEVEGAQIHMIERNAKKAAFLREAVRVTGGAGTVYLGAIEDTVDRIGGRIDYVTARALAPLNELCEFAAPLIGRGTQALFPKGQDVEAELTEATKYWNIELTRHSSRTSRDSCILQIDRLERRAF